MTVDRFHAAVKEAFAEALGLDTAPRQEFLEELKASEPDIAAEVAELLGHHDPDDTFLEASVIDRLPDESQDAQALVGTRVGRFTIKELIASGSMGAVYKAEQDEPSRDVAVKVLRAGAMSPRALRRFRYEAEVLGLLRHPGIAQIYEAGTHSDGALTAPYFAMELVREARPLTRYAREQALLVDARLSLFLKVCGAVHHGHQKGIIHRDLKPANILVGTSGQPKVIDFGVARAVDADPGGTVGTLGGQFVGTLQYMSPEQLRPGGDDIDIRTDIYALGVVLYELICDRPPHNLDGLSLVEAADLLRRKRIPRAGAVNPASKGDLEAIIAKATEPERARRYQSAEALAADVARFLRREPVEASRPGLWRQFRLFARRRAGTVAAVGAVAAVLVLATFISLGFAVSAGHARKAESQAKIEAERSAERSTRVVMLLRDMIALGETGAEASVTGMLDEAVERLDEQLDEDPLVEASLRLAIGQALYRLGRYADAEGQLRAAVRLRLEHLGRDHPETLAASSALALTLAERGMLAEATELAGELEQSIVRTPEADPEQIGTVILTRASLARTLGRPADASALYSRARRVLSRTSPEWRAARIAEAEIALELSRTDDAIAALRDVSLVAASAGLSEQRKIVRLVARTTLRTGRVDVALRRLEMLVEINRADLGPIHPETLLARAELIRARASDPPLQESLDELAGIVSSALSAMEPASPALAELRMIYAQMLTAVGAFPEAVNVLRQRVASLTAQDSTNRPSVVVAVIDVIEAMLEAGQTASAAAIGSELLTTCDSLYPEGSVPRARLVVLLGQTQRLTGRSLIDPGELHAAAGVLTEQLGEEHPLTLRARAELVKFPQ